jgi:hypothetical protein
VSSIARIRLLLLLLLRQAGLALSGGQCWRSSVSSTARMKLLLLLLLLLRQAAAHPE